jgi:outer membrane usher protein
VIAAPVTGGPQPVGLVLNGMAMAEPGLLARRDGRLLARLRDLHELGLETAEHLPVVAIDGDDFVDLAAIAGLSAELDEAEANLKIAADPRTFPHLAFGPSVQRSALSPVLPAQFLAYDLSLSTWRGQTRLAGLLDGGISGDWGVLGSTVLLTGQGLRAVRLDTAFRRDFPDRRLRLVVGDTVSRPAPGGQPLRFGGIQVGTDLSLDPQAINFPLPLIGGSAMLPSTVELLSEAQKQSYQVAPGAFDIAVQPRMSGAGQVTMQIRDITGNSRQVVRNFYTSTDLLRPGMTDFVLEGGALRLGYGAPGSRYGPLFAAAGLRHGLTPWLTGQARVETAAGVTVAAVGGSMVIGALGEISLSGAVSTGPGGTGQMARIQARRTAPQYSLSASYQAASPDFQPAGAVIWPGPAGGEGGRDGRRELTVAGSLSLGGLGGLNLGHALLDEAAGTPWARSFSITSVSYSTGLFGGFISAGAQRTARRSNRGEAVDISVFGSFTLALGPRLTLSQFAETGRFAASFAKTLPDSPGWGLRTLAGRDRGQPWVEGALSLRTAGGDFTLEASRRGAISGTQLIARGGLVRIGGTVLATPRLDYGFALVEVSSDDSVTVMVENRRVPRQAGAGRRVIVTGLQPYLPNHIGIDPAELAIDTPLSTADEVVTPGWRQAVGLRFGNAGRQPGLVRLKDADGAPVPVGAVARWPGGTGQVGHDGEVWLDDYAGGTALVAAYDGRLCRSVLPAGRPLQAAPPVLSCEPYLEAESVL